MKHLKKFSTTTEYDQFKSGSEFVLPNVSFVVESTGVAFNPYVEPLNPNVVCVYDIDDISKESFITATPQYFSKMIIDGVAIEPTEYYQFNSIGNHTIEFTLIDNTIFPSKMFYKTISDGGYGYGSYGYGYQSANIEKCCLISAKIPNGVETICSNAFQGTQVESIVLPKSLKTIEYNAFYDCKNLTSINIPDSVTEIGDYAFSSCSGLTSVTIPDSVTSIGNNVFAGCSSLTSINIPDSVTEIGDYAFSSCSGLTSVTIPDSVTSIGYGAFNFCSNLTSVTIPDSVTSIKNGAFWSCSNLTSITCNAITTPTIDSSTFSEVPNNGNLYVPSGSDYSSWLSTDEYYLGYYNWTVHYI